MTPGRQAPMGAIGIPTGYGCFLIRRIRREVAGAGIGRSLIDVVILRAPNDGVILQLRIGQPLVDRAAAIAAGIAIGGAVGLRARAGIGLPLARRRRRSAGG